MQIRQGDDGSSVLTRRQLTAPLQIYFDEIEKCFWAGCYWALLHLIVVLPDVCAALESENGMASGIAYKRWCARYTHQSALSPEEWYDIRCAILHEGRTRGRREEKLYRFIECDPTKKLHRTGDAKTMSFETYALAQEMSLAVRRWIKALARERGRTPRSRNVQRNIASLVHWERTEQQVDKPTWRSYVWHARTSSNARS